MLKYDQFTNRERTLKNEKDNLKKQNMRKTSALKQKEYALNLDKLKKKFSKFVAGPSSYS
jgi:hypothetical protein